MNKLHPVLRDLLALERTRTDIWNDESQSSLGSRAGLLYCERRRRDAWFGKGIFWEPSWDLLLYLYDAQADGLDSVSIASLSKTPFVVSDDSTLRWVDLLIAQGYVATTDGLRAVKLTQKAAKAIAGYLNEIYHAC